MIVKIQRGMWHKVPEDQDFSDMAFLGDMIFEKPLKKSKSKNIHTIHKWDIKLMIMKIKISLMILSLAEMQSL